MAELQKVQWSRDRKQKFSAWLQNELAQTISDRAPLERKWKDLIIRLRARVIGDGVGSVPFEGASDLDYPLSAIHFEPVYADLMQTLHIPKDFWSVSPLRPDAVASAKPLQEFLSVVERNDIKMRSVNKRAFLDLIGLGTAVYKTSIYHHAKTVADYDESGSITKQSKIQFKPEVMHIPLQDWFMPGYAWEIDPDAVGGAPWVGHRFELTEAQFRARAQGESPFLPNYDKEAVTRVVTYITDDREDTIKAVQRSEDEFVPFRDRKIRLYEIYARFDVDGNGLDEDVVCVWHQETGTVLRSIHIPFLHGSRPFDHANYFPGFGFYGQGLVEADEWAQLALSRLLNSALDSTFLANSKMYGVPQGSMVSFDEPIYPGKIWTLGQGEQIREISMSDVHQGMWQIMDRISQWAESRTGVSELRQGNLTDLPSRTPAATTLSILQEGSKKFDMILANLREPTMGNIGQKILQNIVQISRDDPRYARLALQVLGQEDGAKVVQVLSGPVHDIEDKYGILVSATSSQVNKEVEKQNILALAQTAGAQIYPQMMQYAQGITQLTQDPKVLVDTLLAAYSGQAEFLKRLLEAFDIQNPEVYIPASADALQAATSGEQQQQGQPAGPGTPAAGPAPVPLGGPAGAGPFSQAPGQVGSLIGLG